MIAHHGTIAKTGILAANAEFSFCNAILVLGAAFVTAATSTKNANNVKPGGRQNNGLAQDVTFAVTPRRMN